MKYDPIAYCKAQITFWEKRLLDAKSPGRIAQCKARLQVYRAALVQLAS